MTLAGFLTDLYLQKESKQGEAGAGMCRKSGQEESKKGEAQVCAPQGDSSG